MPVAANTEQEFQNELKVINNVDVIIQIESFKNDVLEHKEDCDHKDSFLHHIIKKINIENISIIMLIIISFTIGMLHTLAPGHGKTIIISYLLGKKAKIKDLITISVTASLTHISGILILSILFLFFIPKSTKINLSTHIELGAGILILLFGIYMIVKYYKDLKHMIKHKKGLHLNCTHNHVNLDKKESFMAGFLSGLAPCPTSWSLFLVFIGLNLYSKAFIYAISFGLGTMLTLFMIGLIFMKTKKILKTDSKRSKISIYLPILSALLILSIGLFTILNKIII